MRADSIVVCYDDSKQVNDSTMTERCHMDADKTGPWVVEVRNKAPTGQALGDWVRLCSCDGNTALAIADALHNLMLTGLVGESRFQVRTRAITGSIAKG